MSETMKASLLNHAHIGKIVRVTKGQATAEDVLVGLAHRSDMIATGGLFEDVRLVPGRTSTTITLQQLGDVECAHYQDVTVED